MLTARQRRFLLPVILFFFPAAIVNAIAGDREALPGIEQVFGAVAVLDVDVISSADQSFTINYYAEYRWKDPALAHDGPGTLRRNLQSIAAPRIILLNEQKTWSSLLSVVDITTEGEAILRERLWGDFSQPLNLRDFPFDRHRVEIPMVALRPVADWRISDYKVEAKPVALTATSKVNGLVVSFTATRIYNHHLIKYIIPLLLIVAMSWVVFWIDPTESSSQLSVAVTAALTLIAYHIALAGKLPDIPYLTRMDLFLFCSTLIVFAALLEVVITSRLARDGRESLARRWDQVCRFLFPISYLAMTGWALGTSST